MSGVARGDDAATGAASARPVPGPSGRLLRGWGGRVVSEDLVLRYKDNNSQRTPCVLVLDGSQSMDGQPIDELNRGLKVLESELKEDVLARGRVRVLVVRVGGAPSVIGDWTDAVDFSVPTIEAYGNTPLGEGMELALESVLV